MMTSAHAFLAPSSAGVWGPGGCAASPRMAQAFPEDTQSLAALEGEAAHRVMEQTALGRPVGEFAPNGQPVTEEMRDGCMAMVADMLSTPAATSHAALEQTVRMPQIHDLNWGRADFIAVDTAAREVFAWDYKFGHGYVDAFENWQLLDYMVGAINHFHAMIGPEWTFDARIYQPRSYSAEGPVKRWSFGFDRFTQMVAELRQAAFAAVNPNAPMTTGAHCQYCPARHACPAFIAVGGTAIDMSMRGIPLEMSAQGAGALLRQVQTARERLEDLETGLGAQVLAAIRGGEAVSGWAAEPTHGREIWTVPAADIIAVAKLCGKDIAKPQEALTPAQARKKGFDETVISAYAKRPTGEMKLKPVDTRTVRKAFEN